MTDNYDDAADPCAPFRGIAAASLAGAVMWLGLWVAVWRVWG